ncbi:hypothetical protein [Halorussus ruber]|uniref:hypothetical protein n=1 Tax=Halorussus ruber TaxID=1126238 RepID=UPI0010922B74|nr:hypothetical protein [Halorussus ruber]
MAVTDEVSFWEMYRELPVRTTLASVVPVLLGFAQLWNGYVHGVSITRTGVFAVVMTFAAVLVTRYHLVEFYRRRLQRELYAEE